MTATGGDGQQVDKLSTWIGSYRKYSDRRRDNSKGTKGTKRAMYSREYPT